MPVDVLNTFFEKAQSSYLSITTSYLSIVTSNLSVTRGHETVTLRSDVVMLRIYVIVLKRSTLMLKISFGCLFPGCQWSPSDLFPLAGLLVNTLGAKCHRWVAESRRRPRRYLIGWNFDSISQSLEYCVAPGPNIARRPGALG
jgi:hypothetical protein